VYRGEIIHRLLYPMLAHLVEVGNQRNGNHFLMAGVQVEKPQVGTRSIDNAPIIQRRGFNIENMLMAFLLHAVPVSVHRVDIHHAVAIGEKIEAPIRKHGIGRGAGPVRSQRHSLILAIEPPQIFRPSTLVTLGLTHWWNQRVKKSAWPSDEYAASAACASGIVSRPPLLPMSTSSSPGSVE